ncbi:MAG: DUF2378 family protein [Archangium sp.]|nr:DUF2378 family protein [Archangium sp.]
MPSEKLVFESSLEAMFVISIHDRNTPELKAALRAVGVDVDKKLPPALSRDIWYAGIEVVAKHGWKELSREDALRAMGRRLIENLQHTLLGKTFGPVMRLLGPERLLKRVPHNMKSANNFSTATAELVAPRTVVIEATDVGSAPELFAGTLEALMAWVGAPKSTVEFVTTTPPAARYTVRWEDA